MEQREIKNEVYFHAGEVIQRYGESRFMFCGLYGSQNYGLDTPTSDVDTKAIILPTLKELLHYKKVSYCFDVRPGEEGQCDVKHIQLMFDNFLKQNINFLELLYTPFFTVNENYKDIWIKVVEVREFLTGCNVRKMIHAAVGMGNQKMAAMEKPFESKLPLIEKYGYDPKQLASLLRLDYFCRNYLQTNDFDSAIHPVDETRNTILTVKSEPPTLETARKMATSAMKHLKNAVEFVDKYYPKSTDDEVEMREYLDRVVELTMSCYLGGIMSGRY